MIKIAKGVRSIMVIVKGAVSQGQGKGPAVKGEDVGVQSINRLLVGDQEELADLDEATFFNSFSCVHSTAFKRIFFDCIDFNL